MKDWLIIVGAIIFIVGLAGGGIAYTLWQYSLCRPEVSDSFWYCFQHAWSK